MRQIVTLDVDYSSTLITQAEARYAYQKAYVAAMPEATDPELARKERELLAALAEKIAGLHAIHQGLLYRDAKRRSNGAQADLRPTHD